MTKKVCFEVNDEGWIMISDLIGKVTVRAHKVGKSKRRNDEVNQHTTNQFDLEGTVRLKPKLFDTSDFIN